MRAGTLSDPRVIAALRKYFVSVHVPMLCTADLIEDPEDRAILEAYNKPYGRKYPGRPKGPFWGGVREVFFGADGRIVTIFQTLYPNQAINNPDAWHDNLLVRRVRNKPDAAVALWFEHATEALPEVPDDWDALRHGTAPEVVAVKTLAVPETPPAADALQVSIRHDRLMYEALVGQEWLVYSAAELASLVPDEPVSGATREWPLELVRRLGRACVPRGDVAAKLEDRSIDGKLKTRVMRVEGTRVHGEIHGRLRLEPRTDKERGRRATHLLWARCRLVGEFIWDREQKRFTRFLMVGRDGGVNFHLMHKRRLKDEVNELKAEVRASEHRDVGYKTWLYGVQPYAVCIELPR